MFIWPSRNPDYSRTAGNIYVPIVASARQETFYAAWGVPDTREGRFEMVALHVALVMLRLGRLEPEGAGLSQAVAETFIADMDDNMREIGIGDLTVPKKVKRAAAALYDRHRDYGKALASDDEQALQRAIRDAISGGMADVHVDATQLANYTARLSGGLAVTSDADCRAGKLPLPWPPV